MSFFIVFPFNTFSGNVQKGSGKIALPFIVGVTRMKFARIIEGM
jgi:hypothetical protein